MNDTSTKEQYLGVLCKSCALPIPVPETTLKRARARETENSSGSQESRPPKLNLRCHACEREYYYTLAEVTEIPGTPLKDRSLSGSSAKLLRAQAKKARVAGA